MEKEWFKETAELMFFDLEVEWGILEKFIDENIDNSGEFNDKIEIERAFHEWYAEKDFNK